MQPEQRARVEASQKTWHLMPRPREQRTHGEVFPRKVCPRLLATPEHPLLFPVPWGTVGEHPELSGHPSDTRDPVSEPELLPKLPEAIKWGR